MNARMVSLVVTLGATLMLVNCGGGSGGSGGGGGGGSGGSGHGGGHSSSSSTGGGTSSSSTTSSTTGTGGNTGAPEAPVMDSVEPLGGGLHVMWTNVTPDCDKIYLDRNKDGGAYATAYTLAGAATSQHDDQVSAPGTYCYKARCEKGGQTSPDSNEKCGTP